MKLDRNDLFVGPDSSIKETMATIDRGNLAIALVVDGERKLLGTVTDGDVRRAILRGLGLDQPVSQVMKRAPLTVGPSTDTQELRRLFLESTLKHIPVVDSEGRVLELRLVSELLSVPLSNPDITDRERDAVLEVLRTSNLSLGPKVVEFEEKIAAYAGRKFAVAVNSGTSGLHLIVKSLGLGPGDEVITTPFSFIASSNCLLYENVTPVFIDIEPDTYNLNPDLIEAAITPRTRAILAVDVFGQPARYDVIEAIARKHGLKVISDCCESIGAEYQGRRSGRFGVAGVFAFYPNKQITTGEGGVVVTDDADVARLCRSYRNQGRGEKGGWLAHERLGYNYRLSEISSALGIVQLARIEEIILKRQKVAETYGRLLGRLPGIQLPRIHPDVTRMSWFVYVVRLADRFSRAERDQIVLSLTREGIGANIYFQPIHLQPFYRERFGFKPGSFPITEAVADRTIALPFHNHLTPQLAETVVRCLEEAIEGAPSCPK
ncbi:MAG: DegT/DnrJ/EryC1/StrS family aminotransferase [Elusimicrobia bacterium]|nr:DegT/DnrJ/EryC1/StrS family aminotransferase [Elusimicrobiota bacterium]